MDLRLLRYFVAVAEERHFTRAAERLGMKQPPLSVAIRQLEADLGVPLLHRLTRGLELTAAGALLLDQARQILSDVDQARSEVIRRARGESGQLKVGFGGATYFHPAIPTLILAYRNLYPEVELSPVQSNTPELLAGLRDGSVNIAFIRPPIEDEGVAVLAFCTEPMCAVLPSSHALATRDRLHLADLAHDDMVLFPRRIGPGLHDSIVTACRAAGFEPRLEQEAPQLPSIVHLVAAGFGVSIVPRSIGQIRTGDVRYVALAGDVPAAPISLASRRDERSATVANFLALARRVGASSADADPAPPAQPQPVRLPAT